MTEDQKANILVKIVDLLSPLNSEERQRVVKAALTLLGDESVKLAEEKYKENNYQGNFDFSPRANSWIKQNGITIEELEQVFHFDQGGVEFIASEISGKNGKEKTQNAYIICGVQKLLSEGGLTFEDKEARGLCENLGCYNQPNHSVYLKSIGNAITGSKSKGWTLTVPGQKRAALLIKEMGGNK